VPANVLVIDDSEPVHVRLAEQLANEDIVLHHALDPIEGLAKAMRVRPDLILLDLDMPHVSGFQVCKRIKADPATAGITVLFLTAATSVQDKVRAFELGAADFVNKPFDEAELRARVRAALRLKRYHDMLVEHARIDPETELGNRIQFEQRLDEELSAWDRYERPVGVTLVDIDGLERINEDRGRAAGDRVLKIIAELMRQRSRPTDIACRLRGGLFGVVLRETVGAGALMYAERLRGSIEALDPRDGNVILRVTTSIGIADTSRWQAGVSDMRGRLLGDAEAALHCAKRAGRNRCEYAGPLPTDLLAWTG
jgi:two-component system cell cycle response regulator